MSLCGTIEGKKRLQSRLNKIEGQVRGINRMIEQDRDCIEVLRQINSINGALKGVWSQLVEYHLKGCVTRAVQDHDETIIDELIEHLQKMR